MNDFLLKFTTFYSYKMYLDFNREFFRFPIKGGLKWENILKKIQKKSM